MCGFTMLDLIHRVPIEFNGPKPKYEWAPQYTTEYWSGLMFFAVYHNMPISISACAHPSKRCRIFIYIYYNVVSRHIPLQNVLSRLLDDYHYSKQWKWELYRGRGIPGGNIYSNDSFVRVRDFNESDGVWCVY